MGWGRWSFALVRDDALYSSLSHISSSNDAYVKTASQKHPWLLGKTCAVGWAEIWETCVFSEHLPRECPPETIFLVSSHRFGASELARRSLHMTTYCSWTALQMIRRVSGGKRRTTSGL